MKILQSVKIGQFSKISMAKKFELFAKRDRFSAMYLRIVVLFVQFIRYRHIGYIQHHKLLAEQCWKTINHLWLWNIVPAFAVRSIQYFRLQMWYIVMHAANVIYCYACSNWSHFIWQVLYFRVVVGLSVACKMSLELTISTVLILRLG